MIEARDISKNYGDKMVLDQVSFQFPVGKITALVGSNGAGKSTLLGIISRILQQDRGEVRINDINISAYKTRDLARQLSVLKQFNHVGLKLTVRELVSFGRFPYSPKRLTAKDVQMVDQAIRFLGLEEMEASCIDELSGGQKQRAYLAMVVAQDTDYILLDEPLNSLDMKHSVQIMKTLRKLADEFGKTILIVLHDINFAACYSDHIIALKKGKILHSGPTHKIIHENVLEEIFGVRCRVTESNGKRICNYFEG